MDLKTRTIGWLLAGVCLAPLTGCGSDDVASGTASDTTEIAVDEGDTSEGEDPAGDDSDDGDHDGEDADHDSDEADHDGEDADHEDEDHDDHDGEDHDDGAASGLGAHEHGAAELTVAWAGSEMVVDLISPTFNIFGFENEPDTDEETALVAERLAALSEPGVFSVNDAAGCSPVGDVTTDVEFEGSHAELTASWALECDNPDEIEQLDAAGLFVALENLEDLDVEWASDSGQSSAELTPSETELSLTE